MWTRLSTIEIELEDGTKSGLGGIELDLFFMLLVVAGSETTRNAISHGLLALLECPDQLATLRENPAAMPGAVDEILRFSSPVTYFARRATRDTKIRGVEIEAGERVTLWYPSGNRDEEDRDLALRQIQSDRCVAEVVAGPAARALTPRRERRSARAARRDDPESRDRGTRHR